MILNLRLQLGVVGCVAALALQIQLANAQPPSSVSVPQLLRNLESDNVKVASSAARSLGIVFAPGGKEGGELPQAVKQLITHLASTKGADIRRESATALGKIRAAEAVDALQKAMTDEDPLVAIAAGESVGKILPVDEARAYLIKRSTEEGESLQAAVFSGLAPVCKAEDAPMLVQGLGAKNWRTRMACVQGLERAVLAGAKLAPVDYDAIASVFNSEMLNASDAASHFFTHVRNPESLRAVLAAADVQDEDDHAYWRQRSQALRTIRHLGWPVTRDALPVVIRQLGDKTVNVTNEARAILNLLQKERQMSHGQIYPLLLAELEKSEPLALRAGIMEEMGHQVSEQYASRVAKVAAETLQRSLEEKCDWPVRMHAVRLVGASGYTGAIEGVAKCVADDTSNVRQAAGTSLEELSPLCNADQKSTVTAILLPLLSKTEDWHKSSVAARAVGYYPSDEAVVPLVKLLSHSVINCRQAASHALALIARDTSHEARRKQLDELLMPELEKNAKAWEFGAPVLGALVNEQALPVLTRMIVGTDWRAQAAGARAVAEIAESRKFVDKPLSDALIAAAQSDVLQVQEAANQALRAMNKDRK